MSRAKIKSVLTRLTAIVILVAGASAASAAYSASPPGYGAVTTVATPQSPTIIRGPGYDVL